jgi:hypothetical protein
MNPCQLTESIWQWRTGGLGEQLFRLKMKSNTEEYGDIVIEQTTWDLMSPVIRVIKADPKALVTHEILVDIRRGMPLCEHAPEYASMGIRLEGEPAQHDPDRECGMLYGGCFEGMMLHVETGEHHYVWRITEYLPDQHAWVATWPD